MSKPVKSKKTIYRFSLAEKGIINLCFDLVLDGKPDYEKAVTEARKLFAGYTGGSISLVGKDTETMPNIVLYIASETITAGNIISTKAC